MRTAMPTSAKGPSGSKAIMEFLKTPFKSKGKRKQSEPVNEDKGRTKYGKEDKRPEPSYEYSKRKSKSKKTKRQPKPFYDDWTREIVVEVEPGLPTRRGIAMVDTHCGDDMISRRFAKHLGFKIKSNRGATISTTIMGEHIHRVAKVQIRWYLDQKDIRYEKRLSMDPTFQSGTFLITNAKNRFDIIIGSRTIERLHLLERRRNFIAPFFRSAQPRINEDTVNAEQARADERRRREQEEMEREQERRARENNRSRRNG